MSERYVLWVDDDRFFLMRSIERFERAGIRCEFVSETDAAYARIREDGKNIEGIILDIMMEPGDILKFMDHKAGFETGFVFYDMIREIYTEASRVFFFTNKDSKRRTYRGVPIYSKFEHKSDKLIALVRRRFGL